MKQKLRIEMIIKPKMNFKIWFFSSFSHSTHFTTQPGCCRVALFMKLLFLFYCSFLSYEFWPDNNLGISLSLLVYKMTSKFQLPLTWKIAFDRWPKQAKLQQKSKVVYSIAENCMWMCIFLFFILNFWNISCTAKIRTYKAFPVWESK